MKRGSIVKIRTCKVFDEGTKERNKAPWLYGVLTYVEKEIEHSGEKAWNVHWAINHLKIAMTTFDHIVPYFQHELTIVRTPKQGRAQSDRYYWTWDFF